MNRMFKNILVVCIFAASAIVIAQRPVDNGGREYSGPDFNCGSPVGNCGG